MVQNKWVDYWKHLLHPVIASPLQRNVGLLKGSLIEQFAQLFQASVAEASSADRHLVSQYNMEKAHSASPRLLSYSRIRLCALSSEWIRERV